MCHSLAAILFLTAPIFGQTKPTKLPLEVVSIVSKTGFGFSKINEKKPVSVSKKFHSTNGQFPKPGQNRNRFRHNKNAQYYIICMLCSYSFSSFVFINKYPVVENRKNQPTGVLSGI